MYFLIITQAGNTGFLFFSIPTNNTSQKYVPQEKKKINLTELINQNACTPGGGCC
jgi:hypothetical protein